MGDTLFFLNPDITTSYALQVEDVYGCISKRNFIVTVEKCTKHIWIPTAFTPNNDGLNDQLGPVIDGKLLSFSFKVFNRWGEIVFSSTNPVNKWNGKLKGISTPGEVFIWVCNYQFKNGLPEMQKGSVVLIR